jgi:hypothetical protein
VSLLVVEGLERLFKTTETSFTRLSRSRRIWASVVMFAASMVKLSEKATPVTSVIDCRYRVSDTCRLLSHGVVKGRSSNQLCERIE